MLIIIGCHTCGKKFVQKTYRHVFCCRKCFKASYQINMKVEKYPSFICPRCHTTTKLDFYPKSSFAKWKEFKCKKCKYMPGAICSISD